VDTAVVVIPEPSAQGLAKFLSERLPGQTDPWVVSLNGDAAIYVNIVPAEEADLEPEDFRLLTARFKEQQLTAVLADVAVRNVGCRELRELVVAILDRFPGLASDDTSEHWWTAEEVRTPERFNLQGFWPHEVLPRVLGGTSDA
jgi:hypothetical protein